MEVPKKKKLIDELRTLHTPFATPPIRTLLTMRNAFLTF